MIDHRNLDDKTMAKPRINLSSWSDTEIGILDFKILVVRLKVFK